MRSPMYGTFVLLRYNKDTVCSWDMDGAPDCTVLPRKPRDGREELDLPAHDPYVPRRGAKLYRCSGPVECLLLQRLTLQQASAPAADFRICYVTSRGTHECEPLRYHHLKTEDKLLLLNEHNAARDFFVADCSVYKDGTRLCVRRGGPAGRGALRVGSPRPPLSRDRLLCEGSEASVVCDADLYVPYPTGLRTKGTAKMIGDVTLENGESAISLRYGCDKSWCGFSGASGADVRGRIIRRSNEDRMYRCVFSEGQQICKEIEREPLDDMSSHLKGAFLNEGEMRK